MKILLTVVACFAICMAGSNFGYVGTGAAGNPGASTDGTLYEQPYDFPTLSNGIYVHGPQFGGADNFTFAAEATVKSITFWTVFTDAGHPYDIAVDIYLDSGGTMGSHFWGETVPAAYQTETLTGDQSWGYNLYRSDLQLQDYPTLPAGNYWLAMSVLGAAQPVGWLVCDPTYPPNMYQYNNGWGTVAYDGWFGLYDHDVALSRTTWGSIKSVF
jgi:hypothetical protein